MARYIWIFMAAVVLAFATPLSSSQGYVIILAMLTVLLLKKNVAFNRNDIYSLFLISVIYVIYLYNTPSVFVKFGYFSVSLVMITMMWTFSMITKNDDAFNIKNESKKANLFDVLFFVFYIICLGNILLYAFENIGDWTGRISTETETFLAGYHHVDFSILVMIVFEIGIRRGYKRLSLVFAVISTIVLPARTLTLFFIIYIICYIFRERIWAFRNKCPLIDKIWKIIFWFVILIVVFSAVWIFVWGYKYEIKQGHEGLFDTSNFVRFQTIYYAFRVIIDNCLIFKGLDNTVNYSSIVNDFPWIVTAGPHNSYFSIFLIYSLGFGGSYLYWISKFIDKFLDEDSLPFVFSYLICGCILHDMLIGPRAFMFLTVLCTPYRRTRATACPNRMVTIKLGR